MAKTPFGILIRYQLTPLEAKVVPPTIITTELHVNLWEFEKSQFIDIGLMIENPSRLGKIVIQVPWKLAKSNLGDLGGRLIANQPLIAAVFNENFNIQSVANVKSCICQGTKNTFSINKLTTHEVQVKENKSSTTEVTDIEISPTDLNYPGLNYFRIRIQDIPKNLYVSEFKQGDRFLLSSWANTHLIDFRINVKRGVPDELLTSPKLEWFKFTKMHFFLLKDKSHNPYFQDSNYIGCRSLEDEDVWADYIQHSPFDKPKSLSQTELKVLHTLAYQWSKKSPNNEAVSDLTIMARFRVEVAGWLQLVYFCIFVLLLGALSSGIWSYVERKTGIENPSYYLFAFFLILVILQVCYSKRE